MRCLLLVMGLFFIPIAVFADTPHLELAQSQKKLAKLEESFDGKIGVYAIDTSNNHIIAYRADERFPVQSTFKLMAVSALLKQSNDDKRLLSEKIFYTKDDLIAWHPVTGQHVRDGMTFEELSGAAISYSDNTAANLITKKVGGQKSITDFAHSIGNRSFNVVHYEGSLNSNPKDNQDNSTPKDMAISLQKLTLGNVLTASQRAQLVDWMRDDTVGYKRIRSGVPMGWVVADKTGSGDYGVANDIGILWSPTCKPIIVAIYTAQNKQQAKHRDDIIASTTSVLFDEFAKNNACFKALSA